MAAEPEGRPGPSRGARRRLRLTSRWTLCALLFSLIIPTRTLPGAAAQPVPVVTAYAAPAWNFKVSGGAFSNVAPSTTPSTPGATQLFGAASITTSMLALPPNGAACIPGLTFSSGNALTVSIWAYINSLTALSTRQTTFSVAQAAGGSCADTSAWTTAPYAQFGLLIDGNSATSVLFATYPGTGVSPAPPPTNFFQGAAGAWSLITLTVQSANSGGGLNLYRGPTLHTTIAGQPMGLASGAALWLGRFGMISAWTGVDMCANPPGKPTSSAPLPACPSPPLPFPPPSLSPPAAPPTPSPSCPSPQAHRERPGLHNCAPVLAGGLPRHGHLLRAAVHPQRRGPLPLHDSHLDHLRRRVLGGRALRFRGEIRVRAVLRGRHGRPGELVDLRASVLPD